MLYLEDYLEMIENLPMEMRDRFTEMREMDLQVQNAMDSLEDRLKKFFEKCNHSTTLKQEYKDEQFKKLKEEYSKALEDADEKVHLTAQVYDLLERYLRKLDMELQKFKLELEADNAGITELLEKRSLELDNPPNNHNHRGEKRKFSQMNSSNAHHGSLEKRVNHGSSADKLLASLANESTRESINIAHRNSASATNSPAANMFNSTPSTAATAPALSYNLGHVGAGSNAAIAAAASRAIGATLEMSQGRRTASLRASYEAVKNAELTKDFPLRHYSTTGAPRSEPTTPTPSTSQKRQKKSVLKSRAQQQATQQSQLAQQLQQPPVATATPPPEVPEVAAEETSASGWTVDPNEPRYCICNDVSYGDMVGCDNEDCPIEWFHYGCVGLSAAPRGKWYCPQCTVAMKRRGRR